MLCEKCGKKNSADATKCFSCGAAMPGKSGCGGFGDILSYEKTASPSVGGSVSSGVDAVEISKLSKHIKRLEQTNKRLGLISLGSLALGVVALGVSVFIMTSSVKKEDVLHEIDVKTVDMVTRDELNDIENVLIDAGIVEDKNLAYEAVVKLAEESEELYKEVVASEDHKPKDGGTEIVTTQPQP